MLEPAMFIGLGAVAFWALPPLTRACGPGSLVCAALHVALSFVGFALLPLVLRLLLPLVPSPYLVLALLFPTLTYLLLSWVWLLARIVHDLFGGTPRGGHPVANEH